MFEFRRGLASYLLGRDRISSSLSFSCIGAGSWVKARPRQCRCDGQGVLEHDELTPEDYIRSRDSTLSPFDLIESEPMYVDGAARSIKSEMLLIEFCQGLFCLPQRLSAFEKSPTKIVLCAKDS